MSETQERWGVWVQRANGTGGWCLGFDKAGHRTYPTREQAQADADATQARNCDWAGHTWDARRYEVTPTTDPRDERIATLAAENARLREASRQIVYIAKHRWRALPADSPEKKCIYEIEQLLK